MLNNEGQTFCPLCGSSALTIEDSVATATVIDAYARSFSMDISSYYQASENLSLTGCRQCGLLHYDPMPTGDAGFYERLQQMPWYYQDDKPEYTYASRHVGAADRVLEVGCGRGLFHSFLEASVDYHGLEFNQAAINKAREQGLDVTAQPIEEHAEQYTDEYDVVCHFQVLEHVSTPSDFMAACVKALKPGGRLIVAVPAEDSFLSTTEGGWLNMPPHHVTRWKDATLRFAYEQMLGLQVEEIWHEPVADYHESWYRSVLANLSIKQLLNRRIRLSPETDLSFRLARKFASLRPIRERLIKRAEASFPFAGRGHTVCVVGNKPA